MQSLHAILAVVVLATAVTASPAVFGRLTADGDVMVAGGYNEKDEWFSAAQTIGGDALPPMPVEDCCNSLSAVGPVIFTCGGQNETLRSAECYSLDTSSGNPEWQFAFSLPVKMCAHAAVTVMNHIWITYENILYDFDTENSELRQMDTSFIVSSDHCAASNGTHSFMVGMGLSRNEIWVNSNDGDPTEFEKIGEMLTTRDAAGCLYFDGKIFIAGGNNVEKKVEIFNVANGEIKSGGDLVTGRDHHKMCILDGKPAVVGGYDHNNAKYLSDIETYDADSDSWSTEVTELDEPKFSFGMAQIMSP